MSRFLIWWLLTVIQIIAVGIAVKFNGIDFLLDADKTYLSFAIVGIWVIASMLVGYTSLKQFSNFDTAWFLSEACISVGMIGTLIGFMYMLANSLTNVDPSNVDTMRVVIADMAQGMSTALVTTLCGLIFSLFIKVQITSQEHTLK